MTPFKRRPLGFLFFTDELKPWYFKYIVGAIICSMAVAGVTIYIIISQYTKIINILGMQLHTTTQSPVSIAKDMLDNAQAGITNILILEAIALIIIGIFSSLYFAYRLMGPLRRIEREINEMATGLVDLHTITLRKGDYLAPVIEMMNKLIEIVAKKSELVEEYKHALKNIKTIIKENLSVDNSI